LVDRNGKRRGKLMLRDQNTQELNVSNYTVDKELKECRESGTRKGEK